MHSETEQPVSGIRSAQPPPAWVDAVAVATLGVGPAWLIESGNAAAWRLLGVTPDQALGRPLTDWLAGGVAAVRPLRRAAEAHSAEAAAAARSEPGPVAGVLRGLPLAREDRPIFVDLHVEPLPPASPASPASPVPPGPTHLVTLVDVTVRAAAEAELARLRARLAESDRADQKLRAMQEELANAATPGDGARVEMVGASASLRRLRQQVDRVAATGTTVLIHGETGSGKELVARSIHVQSARRAQAFVAVNCAALPESLIESELFGHERGAFTGADRRRLGKFELADGGTLFLDEIAELPLPAQAKLLRVIQESAFERVGGVETVGVDVRLLAATHRDLARQVERGRFREDLFYRLSVFLIEVPPLRDRPEDLAELAAHLHERFARRMGRPALPLSEGSLRRIMTYRWPGNVRELANAVERATLLADGPALEIELPAGPLASAGGPGSGSAAGSAPGGAGAGSSAAQSGAGRDILLDLTLEQLTRLQITHALESCGYKVFGPAGAAARLDIHPSTLLARMDKYGIPRPRAMRAGRRG